MDIHKGDIIKRPKGFNTYLVLSVENHKFGNLYIKNRENGKSYRVHKRGRNSVWVFVEVNFVRRKVIKKHRLL
jgi:hypothetical protein